MTTSTSTSTSKQRGRPVDPTSGLSQARAVYASLPVDGRSRKEAIAAFQKITVNGNALTEATSAAYFSVINRKSV